MAENSIANFPSTVYFACHEASEGALVIARAIQSSTTYLLDLAIPSMGLTTDSQQAIATSKFLTIKYVQLDT